MPKKKNKGNHRYLARFQGDGHEVIKKRSAVVDADPIDDPSSVDQEKRIRYFKDNLYPYAYRLSFEEYYDDKFPLQVELVKLQNWVKDAGERVIIIFEGRDAAGKGGTIRRFMEHWNPRGARVVASGEALEGGVGSVVLPALHPAFPDGRRDRALRPVLV